MDLKIRHREAQKRYRLKNKDKIADASKRYQQENRASLTKYIRGWRQTEAGRKSTKQYRLAKKQEAIDLLGGECVRCGSTEHLQFDHINRDRIDDKHTITYMIISTTWKNVLEELKKCQLLCFPCHIKKSTEEKRKLKLMESVRI